MLKSERCAEGKKLDLAVWHSVHSLNSSEQDEIIQSINRKQRAGDIRRRKQHDATCKQCQNSKKRSLALRDKIKQNQGITR